MNAAQPLLPPPNPTMEQFIAFTDSEPLFLTNQTLDRADPLDLGARAIFEELGAGVTDDELDLLAEDYAGEPYGGFGMAYTAYFKRRKCIACMAEICFDGPDRPFSLGSYGVGVSDTALYEDAEQALAEAERFAAHLRGVVGGLDVVVVRAFEVDRHGVAVMIPFEEAASRGLLDLESRYNFLVSLFDGFTPRVSSVTLDRVK